MLRLGLLGISTIKSDITTLLSRWHTRWLETWASDSSGLEISTLSQTWANRIREMAGVLV